MLNSHTTDYLDAVVNPLNHTKPVKLPDGINEPTIPMVDYYVASQITVDVGPYVVAPANAIGALIFPTYTVTRNSFNQTGLNSPYRLLCLPVSTTLAPILYFASNGIPSIAYSNVVQLLALSKSFRLLAGGVRITPQVEVVTNTATQYITKYYGGCLSSTDIQNYVGLTSSLLSLFQSSKEFLELSNAKGMCSRLNMQQYPIQRLFFTAGEAADSDIVNFDKWYNSVIYVEFNLAIAPVLTGVNYGYTFPARIYSKLWLEAQLIMPSPIISDNGYNDMNLSSAISALQSSGSVYPCLCEGHTFSTFLSKLKPFYNTINGVINAASTFLPDPRLRAIAAISNSVSSTFNNKVNRIPSINQINNGIVKNKPFQPLQGKKRKNKRIKRQNKPRYQKKR